jgi:hypothetical protein
MFVGDPSVARSFIALTEGTTVLTFGTNPGVDFVVSAFERAMSPLARWSISRRAWDRWVRVVVVNGAGVRVDGELFVRWCGCGAYVYETIAYGPRRDHVGDLRLRAGEGPFAVVVLLHGGFWRECWERDTIEPLAVDLARRGAGTRRGASSTAESARWAAAGRRPAWMSPPASTTSSSWRRSGGSTSSASFSSAIPPGGSWRFGR